MPQRPQVRTVDTAKEMMTRKMSRPQQHVISKPALTWPFGKNVKRVVLGACIDEHGKVGVELKLLLCCAPVLHVQKELLCREA
jgi:hypothetical protein